MKLTATVYTCNVNNYDFVLPPLAVNPNLTFVCFTDHSNRRIRGWDVRPLRSPPEITDPTLINRYHKFFPQNLGFDTEWSVYVDGNMRVIGPVIDLVYKVRDNGNVMACLQHPSRSTVQEEIEACSGGGKLTFEQTGVALERYQEYEELGMPTDVPLYANKVIIRRHTDSSLASAMTLWWDELQLVPRDQISLPFVVWKTRLKMHVLPVEDFRRFHWYGHRKRGLAGLLQLVITRKDEPFYKEIYQLLRFLRRTVPRRSS